MRTRSKTTSRSVKKPDLSSAVTRKKSVNDSLGISEGRIPKKVAPPKKVVAPKKVVTSEKAKTPEKLEITKNVRKPTTARIISEKNSQKDNLLKASNCRVVIEKCPVPNNAPEKPSIAKKRPILKKNAILSDDSSKRINRKSQKSINDHVYDFNFDEDSIRPSKSDIDLIQKLKAKKQIVVVKPKNMKSTKFKIRFPMVSKETKKKKPNKKIHQKPKSRVLPKAVVLIERIPTHLTNNSIYGEPGPSGVNDDENHSVGFIPALHSTMQFHSTPIQKRLSDLSVKVVIPPTYFGGDKNSFKNNSSVMDDPNDTLNMLKLDDSSVKQILKYPVRRASLSMGNSSGSWRMSDKPSRISFSPKRKSTVQQSVRSPFKIIENVQLCPPVDDVDNLFGFDDTSVIGDDKSESKSKLEDNKLMVKRIAPQRRKSTLIIDEVKKIYPLKSEREPKVILPMHLFLSPKKKDQSTIKDIVDRAVERIKTSNTEIGSGDKNVKKPIKRELLKDLKSSFESKVS